MTAGSASTERSITERQNDPVHLTRLLAYSHEYTVAQFWHGTRMLGTLVLAAASPIVVIWWPGSADLLAAIAAGWLVAGRTALVLFEDRHLAQGARIQELYDTELFGLGWNTSVAGRPPSPEDVAHAASRIKDNRHYIDWYTVDVGGLAFPADVLLCQRQSAVWARWDHRAYALFIAVAGATWFAVGVIIALARDLSLADYLVKLFLPSAPAYLDTIELARAHRRRGEARQRLEDDIADLWEHRRVDPAVLSPEDCRRIQDGALVLRRNGPKVPNWYYKIRRAERMRATTAGARTLRAEGKDGEP